MEKYSIDTLSRLSGRVYTIIEAITNNPDQCKSSKDLIRNEFSRAINEIEQGAKLFGKEGKCVLCENDKDEDLIICACGREGTAKMA